jgi:ATP-dependent Clp protease ATP-binding subunit ClpC
MLYNRYPNFTERNYKVLSLAQDIAKVRGDGAIAPLHVALGLLREGQGVAATVLHNHGIALETLEQEFLSAPLGTGQASGLPRELPLSADCERLLAQARTEAEQLRHSYVGTEHLLLALLREGSVSLALARHGLTSDTAKADVVVILSDNV